MPNMMTAEERREVNEALNSLEEKRQKAGYDFSVAGLIGFKYQDSNEHFVRL